jgi:hypothetical protein
MPVHGELVRLMRYQGKDAPLSLLVKEGSRRKEKDLLILHLPNK